jgi:hypothetical protein
MFEEIDAFLSKVNVEVDWQPTPELMMEIFSTVADSVLSEDRYHRYDSGPYTNKIINPNVILWHWQNSKVSRYKTIKRLANWYNHTDWHNGYRAGIGEDNISAIRSILASSWNELPEDSTSVAVQELRILISLVLKDPSMEINFAQKLMESNLAGNRDLSTFWTREGMERSKDPAFFSMAWSRVERQKGYTDARDSVIRAASKCRIFPESIIDDLTSGGHNKNRLSLVGIMVNKIEDARHTLSRTNGLTEELRLANTQYVEYCQSILAKFVSCDDYSIQQRLIPFLKREDLIFAAPTAAKLGLGNLVDRYMNPESYEQKRYRY